MEWLDRMKSAMDYIENHLEEEVDPAEAAKRACCSVTHFQRMFSFITGVHLSEYIRRRRLTLAGFALQEGNVKVIDVALKYGYDSPEAFSRAFKQLHGIMPTAARGKGAALKAFPRLSFHISIRGDVEMNYRIEEKQPFKMAGLTADMDCANGKQYADIPKMWETGFADGSLQRLSNHFGLDKNKDMLHAALYNFRERYFTYMIGAVVPVDAEAGGFAVLEVPALTWAIFPTGEHTDEQTTEAIQAVWKRIYPEWFPTSGYEHAEGPEFEMYHNLGNGRYVSEVWIPVVKK
jgi:AraC family transcriptional regulator